jgi:hypothetical protein
MPLFGGIQMKSLFVLAMVLASTSLDANDLVVIPCWSKLQDGRCPERTDLPKGTTLGISNNDYYSLSVESVCVDQPDSWWHNKLVSLNVTYTIASNDAINVPLFNDRAEGAGCRLPVNNSNIITSVPANAQILKLSATIIRSDANDGLKKLLGFATATSQQTQYTTYFTRALPYVSLATTFGQQVYDTFAEHQEKFLNDVAPTTLHPASDVHRDKFDLQDGYLVQYSGPDSPADYKDLYVDSGDLRWSNGSYLRGGATWILYKVQKFTRRTDYPSRPWYEDWAKSLADAAAGSIDASTLTAAFQRDVILLLSDEDFTVVDRQQYVADFKKDRDAALAELGSHQQDALKAAIATASQEVVVMKNGKESATAVSASAPTVIGARNGERFKAAVPVKVLVPGRLAAALKR